MPRYAPSHSSPRSTSWTRTLAASLALVTLLGSDFSPPLLAQADSIELQRLKEEVERLQALRDRRRREIMRQQAGAPQTGEDGEGTDSPVESELPFFDPDREPYRSLRAGEGFRTRIFGRDVNVPQRDRRAFAAWDLGSIFIAPEADESEVTPFASLFFWRRPDENSFLRAVVVGVYNEIIATRSSDDLGGFEAVFTLDSFTLPIALAPLVDGQRLDREELYWGYVRPGLGFGYRTQVKPGANDNMFSVNLTAEPGFLYFDDGEDTGGEFIDPQDTFETRAHLSMRWDALERNLLELPHAGFATGIDLVYGYRHNWEDWGSGRREKANEGKDYRFLTGHISGATGVPFVQSERHRMLLSLHGGVGKDLDRFSSLRIGGGPVGDEFESLARPVLPGAAIDEFLTDYYAIAVGEYRWEPIFFTYLSLRGSVSYLNRDRILASRIQRVDDDILGSLGIRLTSGFFFDTRVQVDYNYNWEVVRRTDFGGHEVVIHLSGEF